MSEPVEEKQMSIDAESIVLKLGIILFSYVLVVVLIFAPWLVIRCRARYKVVHAEWRCRACKTSHHASLAVSRACRHCGKVRHFVNPAPKSAPVACVLVMLYGFVVACAGAVLMRYDGHLDKKQLIKMEDVQMAPNYAMTERYGKHVMDSPISMTMKYVELYTDLPVHIEPMDIVVTYCSRKIPDYKQQIGHAEVPALKMYPGDELGVSMTMHVEMETAILLAMMEEMAGSGALLEIGPSILNYEVKPGKFTSWILGDSDLKVTSTVDCAIVSTFADVLLTNCTDQANADEDFADAMNFYFLFLTVLGCLTCAAGALAFEWHLRGYNADSARQMATARRKRPSLAPALAGGK